MQFSTLSLQRRTHTNVLVHNQKKPNILYVMLQGAKFKPGITLVQQLTSSLYFQAPYYINFFFYFLKKELN